MTPEVALDALTRFEGVERRLEVRGTVRDVTVYDDFAHHPTAITLTVEGLRRQVGDARILAVLEPRSNTMKLGVMKDQLPASLAQADKVFCYAANLGWEEPQALTAGRIATLAAGVGPWLGLSLRVVVDPRGREFLRGCGASVGRLLWMVPLAALLIALLRANTPDIWRCMLLGDLVLIPTALLGLRLPWRALLRPGLRDMLVGTAAALVLYGLASAAAWGLRSFVPGAGARLAGLNLWGGVLPLGQTLPILLLVVAGERDSFTPAYLAGEMAAAVPNAELLVVPNGTHVAPREYRELVHLRIDKFLRDRALT